MVHRITHNFLLIKNWKEELNWTCLKIFFRSLCNGFVTQYALLSYTKYISDHYRANSLIIPVLLQVPTKTKCMQTAMITAERILWYLWKIQVQINHSENLSLEFYWRWHISTTYYACVPYGSLSATECSWLQHSSSKTNEVIYIWEDLLIYSRDKDNTQY